MIKSYEIVKAKSQAFIGDVDNTETDLLTAIKAWWITIQIESKMINSITFDFDGKLRATVYWSW